MRVREAARAVFGLCLASVLLATSSARAYDDEDATGTRRMRVTHYEVSAFTGLGGPLAIDGVAVRPRLSGIQVVEHNGPVLQMIGGAKSRYSDECSDACSHMELSVFGPGPFHDDRAQALGWELLTGATFRLTKLRPIGDGPRLPVVFTLGTHLAFIRAEGLLFEPGQGPNGNAHPDAVHAEDLKYANIGFLARLTVPVTTWIEGFAQWDVNLFQIAHRYFDKWEGTMTSPLRVGATMSFGNRLFVRGARTINAFGSYGLGWQLDGGVRF